MNECLSGPLILWRGRAGATNHVGGNDHSPYPDAVDAHAVGLFLFAQLYQRQAARPDTMDVWPGSEGPSNSGINSSSSSGTANSVAMPMDTAPSFSRAGFTSNSPRSSSAPHASGAVPESVT